MKLNLKIENSSENSSVNINYEIEKDSAYIELPEINRQAFYKLLLKNDAGEFTEYLISYDANINLRFLSVGDNIFKLKLFENNNLVWQTEEFSIKIEKLNAVYTFYGDEVHVLWNKVKGADGYMLYKKTDKHLFTSFKETKDNEVSLYGLPMDTVLKLKPFRIENGKKIYDFPILQLILKDENDYCNIIYNWGYSIKVNKSTAKLFWKKINSADCYKIYALVNDELKLIDTVDENVYILKFLPLGCSYFCIKAFCSDRCLCKSVNMAVNINNFEIAGLNFDKGLMLYWNKVSDIDGYRLYKKNENNEFVGFLSTVDEKVVLNDVSAGEKCEFKVKPFILKDGERKFIGYSAKCKIDVYKTSLINIIMNEAYDNKIAISWLFDGDVDGFVLFKDGVEYLDINDGLSHIVLVDYSEADFVIKGYKNVLQEKVFTCSSMAVNLKNAKSRTSQENPKSYKISVIIPAYNSQDYISRSISSVLGSDIDDIELVIVDDGSTDNTKEIINWYAEKYPAFVKKLFKKNGGVADTRNAGIEFAHGKYIAFMDNDDLVRPYSYSVMYDAIEKTSSDIAISPLYRIDNDKYIVRHNLPFPENIAIDIEDYLKLIFTDKFNNIGVWNKLYKAKLVKEHPFGLLAYEDVSWTPYILSWADKFCYVNKICYEWDRKIRTVTFSNVLSNRSAEEKFAERYQAFRFFYDKGNPKRKECLAYIMAKRLYGQGCSAKYEGYFNAISDMKEELINNKFLLEDKEYFEKLAPLIK